MPKMKTHSGAKKRFKLSKSGKVKRSHAFASHILTKKTTKRKRGLRKGVYLSLIHIYNLLIAVLSALAELESQQKSEAIKNGIRWRMAEGIYQFSVINMPRS